MLYTVKMKYFDEDGDCYGVMEGKFPYFSLAWKMVNLVKPEDDDDEDTKFYKMILAKEDEDNEYFAKTDVTYTTCDGARRALNRAPKDEDGNRQLVLTVSWDYGNPKDETHVLIIMKAEADKDF